MGTFSFMKASCVASCFAPETYSANPNYRII